MRRSHWVVGAVLAAVMLASVPGLLAQVSETDVLQQLRADLRADRQAVVAAAMQLSDAEGQAFWPVYRQYREEMATKVGDRLQKLIQEFAKVYDKATPEQARSMVDEMMAISKEELKLKESYLPKFRKVLSQIKTARYYQVENKIQAALYYELAQSIPLVKVTE